MTLDETSAFDWPHPLSKDCCGARDGHIVPKSGQNCLYCDHCGAWDKNVPKHETGERPVDAKTIRRDLQADTKKRALVLQRAGHRCEDPACQKPDEPLEIGHCKGVADWLGRGHRGAVLIALANSDRNLYATCRECNDRRGFNSLDPDDVAEIERRRAARGAR